MGSSASSPNVSNAALQKSGNYSWGGLMDSRSQKKADANNAAMQGQIDSTERKLLELSGKQPGYSFAYNSPEFQSMRNDLKAGGPLEQYEAARSLLNIKAGQNMDRQTSDLAGQQAGAFSQLAMGGGLSGGSRERVASGAAQSNLFNRQALRGETQSQYAELAGQEANEKLQMQQQMANILAQEEMRNQQLAHDRWKTEMDTRAAIEKSRQQATATASSCFAPGTMITMEDGSQKRIEHVKVGDTVKCGGLVYATQTALYKNSCFEYGKGVFVTGSHAVYEDGVWLRVKDSKGAKTIPYKLSKVYNLGTTNHKILIGETLFSDLHETDSYDHVTDEESLALLNRSESIVGIENGLRQEVQ